MSGIAGQEIILIIIIGLIVLGPKRLPQVANQVGSWLGQARRMTRMMKRQLEDEVNFDLNKELGIDEHGNPIPSSTVASPGFVQDRDSALDAETHTENTIHGDDDGVADRLDDHQDDRKDDGEKNADETLASEPKEDLPDDYSPAHAADDVGTGVGEHDELDAVLEAARDSEPKAEPLASADSAEPVKKEPA